MADWYLVTVTNDNGASTYQAFQGPDASAATNYFNQVKSATAQAQLISLNVVADVVVDNPGS